MKNLSAIIAALSVLTLAPCGVGVYAQSIQGTVVDDAAYPLPYAIIQVEETDRYTITDADGRYTISASPGDKLIFSCIGFDTEERIVSETGRRMDVVLSLSDVYFYNPINVAIYRRCLDTEAGVQETPAGTIIADFVGQWRVEYIHDPDDPADDLLNHSFDLDLYPDFSTPDSLYGWHRSLVRGGRKVDMADWKSGDAPSILGQLCGDTLYVSFESGWEVAGKAKLYFADPERRALVWELGDYAPDKEHYMPQRDTLAPAQSMQVRGTIVDKHDATPPPITGDFF